MCEHCMRKVLIFRATDLPSNRISVACPTYHHIYIKKYQEISMAFKTIELNRLLQLFLSWLNVVRFSTVHVTDVTSTIAYVRAGSSAHDVFPLSFLLRHGVLALHLSEITS